jgi:hypothetical protein
MQRRSAKMQFIFRHGQFVGPEIYLRCGHPRILISTRTTPPNRAPDSAMRLRPGRRSCVILEIWNNESADSNMGGPGARQINAGLESCSGNESLSP